MPTSIRWTVLAVCLLFPSAAHATPLLTSAFEGQLEAWLGQGNLDFTNVFTKNSADPNNDDSLDFHAKADGKGATFTLLEAVVGTQTFVIGGYNPLSWSSIFDYNPSTTDAQRTAFIYNLTTGVKMNQRLSSDIVYFGGSFDFGVYQTYNYSGYGPTFGGGHDILVNSALNGGYAVQFSYGSGAPCGYGGQSIVGVTYLTTPCPTSAPYFFSSVGALEVYTFAPAAADPLATPEPATLTMLGLGLLGAARYRRKMVR
ncbi:MAG: PEP_CTERM-anchored TLD domain-containing protein [Acidobacteria bacterium]|nr:PEP_CTERM-anchored TLD domain-containing protein [Acidobacteriota bacterium]